MSTRTLGCALFSTACMLALACHSNAPAAPKLADPYASRCQDLDAGWMDGSREIWPQGTKLWGSARLHKNDKSGTVLAAVKTQGVLPDSRPTQGVRVSRGQLVPLSNAGEGAAPPSALIGAVLHGTDSKGEPMAVAICTAVPDAEDPDMTWYKIQVWNDVTISWQNPCVETKAVPHPRVLAVRGTWDATGAHRDSDDELTFACETGAIAKCASWGYKPWAERNGQSLAAMHQACTRMARADYCGNGESHTNEGTIIDMFDGLKILEIEAKAKRDWNPDRALFEAAWAPDGATCVARTRDGRPLDEIRKKCSDRFEKGPTTNPSGEDTCNLKRTNVAQAEKPLLRNLSQPAMATTGPSTPSP